MRLWHYKLVKNSLLPTSQLVAQFRELGSIFAKEDNHILINYIYNYDKDYLAQYTKLGLLDFKKRGYTPRKWDNINAYFYNPNLTATDITSAIDLLDSYITDKDIELSYNEHDNDYLTICYYNLKEKYTRGQKDFTDDMWNRLDDFYKEVIT